MYLTLTLREITIFQLFERNVRLINIQYIENQYYELVFVRVTGVFKQGDLPCFLSQKASRTIELSTTFFKSFLIFAT
jgi:hypothetical protein